jgi:hypothetical protein
MLPRLKLKTEMHFGFGELTELEKDSVKVGSIWQRLLKSENHGTISHVIRQSIWPELVSARREIQNVLALHGTI